MDISGAYPAESCLEHYYRKCTLIKGEKIIIKDSYSFRNHQKENTVVLSFMTYEKPVLEDDNNGLTLHIGSVGIMRITDASLLSVEEIPITDPRLKITWKHPIYRVLVTSTHNEIEMHIS